MQHYRVNLRDRTGCVMVREGVEAENADEAADIAALLCDACSDVAAYFEVWDGKARASSLGLPVILPSALALSAHAQQIVFDRLFALQDTNRRLQDSKALLRTLDEWFASGKGNWTALEARTIEYR